MIHRNLPYRFLRGQPLKMAPRETENNAYAKFWSDKQRALWYVMAFSGMANIDVQYQVNAGLLPLHDRTHKLTLGGQPVPRVIHHFHI